MIDFSTDVGKIYDNDESYAFVESYVKSIDFDFTDDTLDSEFYVSHPESLLNIKNIFSQFFRYSCIGTFS